MGWTQIRASQLSPLSLLDGPLLFLGCNSYIDMGTNEGRCFDILLELEKRPQARRLRVLRQGATP